MSKYEILKEFIEESLEREKENFREASKSAGVNCAGASMAIGAVDAFEEVLTYIEELEEEALSPELKNERNRRELNGDL